MTVFFDIDDTLYDRGMPFVIAAQEFFGGKVPDPREAYRLCKARGDEVFHASQRGEISMDEMYIYRWGRGFADAGISITPEEALRFQKLYRGKQDSITLSPVLENMLLHCSGRTRTGVISNGPAEKQWNKVLRLGLERFMDRDMIIISGDVGVDKPDAAIFRIAEQRSGAKPEELLYVGDAPDGDIYSAEACGWRTVWFNREGSPVPADIHPLAVAENEEELAAVMLKLI